MPNFDSNTYRGLDEALLAGATFTASESESAGGNSTHSITLRNPSNSGMGYLVYYGEVTHEAQVSVEVFSEMSVSGGTTPEVGNNHVGHTTTTTATVLEDATLSSTTTHTDQVYVTSGTERILNGFRMWVPEGEDLALSVTDQSGNTDEMGIRLSWAELRH